VFIREEKMSNSKKELFQIFEGKGYGDLDIG
jgi:hypothetical protein